LPKKKGITWHILLTLTNAFYVVLAKQNAPREQFPKVMVLLSSILPNALNAAPAQMSAQTGLPKKPDTSVNLLFPPAFDCLVFTSM
jgi:hypothetical protein